MQIVIKSPSGSGIEQWVILELQGELQSFSSSTHGFSGLELGSLEILENGNPRLTIGNHQADGKIVKLRKPLAVIRKEKDSSGVFYETKAMVLEKYLFKTRPHTLASQGKN
eukprot:TRINITY_DN2308_c0_g1_i3.p1 TRINITY_DN2308_c0_g1~~TRINITY_DN2308_c0_g1_i3.p1  ORF type:complete len:111 (+),score=13.74 TRINITY_DN2308_c0_g1_i3:59-391(+)